MPDMRTVFFDLDGTLTDPRPGIIKSIQFALDRLHRSVPEEEALLWCIGPPLRQSFVTLLGSEADADRGVALYRERFGDVGLFENRVYAGMEAELQTLIDAGYELHVATSKPHVYARRILQHFGLSGYFAETFGAELSGERSDKTELLGHALAVSGADPARSMMVGDRAHDMIGAANNGIGSVGVLYGYGSREELTQAGAGRLANEVEELAAVLVGASKTAG